MDEKVNLIARLQGEMSVEMRELFTVQVFESTRGSIIVIPSE